jgi:hypothetical protein
MGLLDQLTGIVDKYANPNSSQPPPNVESDFDHVSKRAPPEALAEGLSHAFRSEQTPSFGEMASHLFSQANPQQRAGLLSTLLRSVSSGGLGGLAADGSLSSVLSAFKSGNITPDHAQQLSPDAVTQLAEHAQKQNPSVIDEVSRFVSQHPGLVKTLGAGALSLVLGKMAQDRRSR